MPGGWVGSTATEIARGVTSGEVTAREVTEQHLAHIASVDGRVGAFEVVDAEGARASAEALDARDDLDALPLAGVPVAVKDVLDVAGLPTRYGSSASSAKPARDDDELVVRLRRAGAVVVGKTRCPELGLAAASDNPFGVARNPWDLGRVAGGSSGGSAAALAASEVPLAVGSDGGGSIRLPSAACGTFGIKPGEGTVPRRSDHPAAHWHGMSRYGPMATTVEDAARLLDVLAATDRFAPALATRELAPCRIAVSDVTTFPLVPIDRSVRRAWIEAIRQLRAEGHRVDRATPDYPSFLGRAVATRSFQGAAHDVRTFGIDEASVGPRARTILRLAQLTQRRLPVVTADAEAWKRATDAFFTDYDLLMTPATASPAFPHRDWHRKGLLRGLVPSVRLGAFTSPWNLADVPAAVVPMGFSRGGLPVGVQLVGGRGGEELVLQVAAQLEARHPWPRHAPGWLEQRDLGPVGVAP